MNRDQDAGEPREDHLELDLNPGNAGGDAPASPSVNRPAEGARVVTPGQASNRAPGGGGDFLDLTGAVADEDPAPASADHAPLSLEDEAPDIYAGVDRSMLDLEVDEQEPGPTGADAASDFDAQEVQAPEAMEPVAEIDEQPSADDGAGSNLDLDLDVDDPAPRITTAATATSEPSGLEADADDLEITDDAPEGTYERPPEAQGMGAPAVPVAIGDESESGVTEDEGIFDRDGLGIDFDAPAERIGPPRGAIVGAALAGAVLTAALAIVDPGGEPELITPELRVASVDPADPRTTDAETAAVVDEDRSDAEMDAGGDAPERTFGLFNRDFAKLFSDPFGQESASVGNDDEVVEPSYSPEELAAMALTSGGTGALPAGLGQLSANADGSLVNDAAELDRESRTAELSILEQLNIPEDMSGLRIMQQEDLEDIWLGNVLPPRGVDGRRNRLTPHVGPVRLTTDLGEIFEGDLYSIGGGEVSLSTHLGRITFEASQVELVQRLPDVAGAAADGDSSQPGERVRVQTPGGWIQGRLLSRDGARVTLITDTGGRITLEGANVQLLGQRSGGAFLAPPRR
ncbi:hypothetical protein [Engelhardtia mirabilis]